MKLKKLLAKCVIHRHHYLAQRLDSGHTLISACTNMEDVIQLPTQTTLNALNLIDENTDILAAIKQTNMHIGPVYTGDPLTLNVDKSVAIIYCPFTLTYAVLQQGLFSLYGDAEGVLYTCWSHTNVRNHSN